MTLGLRPFTTADLPAARELLLATTPRDGHLAPAAGLADEWARPFASGVAAERAGRLEAFVVGGLVEDHPWPRQSWTGLGGWGLAPGAPVTALEDCYAAAARGWVDDGRLEHVLVAPAADAAEPWWRLGFAVEQVHALRPAAATPRSVPGVTLRRADPDDLDRLRPLVDLVALDLVRSPCFAPTTPSWRTAVAEGHAELLADDAVRYWVAVDDRATALGFAVLTDAGGPGVPAATVELKLAATAPNARRRGIGAALVTTALAEEAARGARWCAADWRAAALPAARAWGALGFAATHLRLRRRLDPRIAWARG